MDNNLDKVVAEYLIKAQLCSDGGKHFLNDWHPWTKKANEVGYGNKDYFISKAIRRISSKAYTGFSYYIAEQSNCYIIYFNFKYNGERKQISFHSFGNWKKISDSNSNKRHATRWDKDLGGSREACFELYDYIKMDVEEKYNYDHIVNGYN